MKRRSLAGLLVVTAYSFSCRMFGPSAADLPSVDAPPPAPIASIPEIPVDPYADRIRRHLARYDTGLLPHELKALAQTIVSESRRHKLDPALVLAVMQVESRYNNFALSPVGAMGLMQVMPRTGEETAARYGIPWYGPQTLFDPILNVRIGVAYLKQLSDRYEALPTALAAYNWGPSRIDRRLSRGSALPTEYPRLVTRAYGASRLPRSS